MPAWQDPEIQDRRETGFVFSLMEILLLVFLYHYVGLLRELVKNPIIFSQFLYIFWAKSKMHIFPLQREMVGKENVQNLSVRSSVSSAAEHSHSRQAGCTLTLETAKQRRETHRHTFWCVPKDYFCSWQPAPSQDNNEGMLLQEAPYVPPHFADGAFAVIFLPGSSRF